MISDKTIEQAQAHALADYPRESVGVVVRVDDAEAYIPCPNSDANPEKGWTLAAEDYADAEDMGEVLAIIHSHPNGTNRASDVDRLSCEAAGVPYGIIPVGGNPLHTGETGWIKPCGWEAPLVGREFHYGVLDCYSVIKDWYEREQGINLPQFDHGPDKWWDKKSAAYMPDFDPYMDHFAEAGFVEATGAVQVGDIFLMQLRAEKVNHAGVYIGDGVMLHHLWGRLSERVVYGGMWAEVTRKIIRRAA